MRRVYVTNFGNIVSVIGPVAQESADLAMSVNGPSAAADGTRFTEQVTVTNNGSTDATDTATTLLVPNTWP